MKATIRYNILNVILMIIAFVLFGAIASLPFVGS